MKYLWLFLVVIACAGCDIAGDGNVPTRQVVKYVAVDWQSGNTLPVFRVVKSVRTGKCYFILSGERNMLEVPTQECED